jgi:hypothetical protein
MCDIFSIGIIMYEIYARQDPYQGEDFRDTLRKVCDRRVNKRPGVPESCPAKIADTMKKCWSVRTWSHSDCPNCRKFDFSHIRVVCIFSLMDQPDPFFRPSAKDLDTLFLDMNSRDAEPLTTEEQLQARARKERSTEDMLYELFPRHVADQLKAGKKVEPENHEEVTVVFSDIGKFSVAVCRPTELCRKLPWSHARVLLFSALYRYFQSLVASEGLQYVGSAIPRI